MSTKDSSMTWQRELYSDVYSWIREFNRSGNQTPFRRVLVNTLDRQAIMGRALISYQQSKVQFEGWQNPLRAGHFRAVNPKADVFSDIPF